MVVRVRLKGIKETRKRLADGSVKTFRYLRANNERLVGEPGSPEFMASYNAALAKLKTEPEGIFRVLLTKYRASADFTGKAKKTQADYKTYLRRIEDNFGELPIAALDDRRVRGDFLEWRDSFSGNPRAADYAWSVLNIVLNWSVDRGLIDKNPCERGGRLYKGGNRAEVIWSPEALAQLMQHASPEVVAAVMLGLWTGQRMGDLLRMPWSAIRGDKIHVKQSKTGAQVAIPVGATLARFMASLPRKSTTILANTRGRSWTTDGFKTSFYKSMDRAGLDDLHFHDLRGTAVTRLALSGCTVSEIAAITGHSLRDVEAILQRHYLGGRVELAESAALKLESRYGDAPALAEAAQGE